MAEPATSVAVVEDSALMERLAAEGIETGDAVSAADWLTAAWGWATDGWGPSLPEFSGTGGLARFFIMLVVVGLGVAAIRWLVRQARRVSPLSQETASVPLLRMTPDADTTLEEALDQQDVERILAACWQLVEHRLDAVGVQAHRPDRSAYELVVAVKVASPSWRGAAALQEVAGVYVRLRYGASVASLDDARALALASRRFVASLTVEVAA